VSAIFVDRATAERAIPRLTADGVPRDLVEVVVSAEAARHFYAGVRPANSRETVRYAGIGGLVGLLVSVVVSLAMISLQDFAAPGATAVVQLLGPNMGAVAGAALGALFGLFRRRAPEWRHRRAAEAAGEVVVVVRARDERHVAAVVRLLAAAGGVNPRIERR
jgi:hypothetical protein